MMVKSQWGMNHGQWPWSTFRSSHKTCQAVPNIAVGLRGGISQVFPIKVSIFCQASKEAWLFIGDKDTSVCIQFVQKLRQDWIPTMTQLPFQRLMHGTINCARRPHLVFCPFTKCYISSIITMFEEASSVIGSTWRAAALIQFNTATTRTWQSRAILLMDRPQ